MNPLHIFSSTLAASTIDPNAPAEGTIGGLLFYIVLAIGTSFLCSVLEAVILSASHSHIELLADRGRRAGKLMQKHKANVERPISAILTLNTIAHTVGAAGAGAQAVGVFGNEWFGVISAVLTFLILFFSEIIPKTIGATYWKQLMPFSAYTIQFLVLALYPAVWGFEFVTRVLRPAEEAPTVTRSELEVMARISTEEGALLERESRILGNLLQLRNIQVETIMTPRTVVMAFQQDLTVSDVLSTYRLIPYSRIPIYDESTDDIKAFVLRYDIFRRAADDQDHVTMKEFAREIRAIPETNSVAQVLDEFVQNQEHIFLVIDEYGGTAGIITLEDAVETLLGIEITDESDVVDDLRKLAAQRYERQSKLLNQIVTASEPNPTSSD